MYNRACVPFVNIMYVCTKNKKNEAVKKKAINQAPPLALLPR